MAVEFEWDEAKERQNLRKHGISFVSAIEAFRDPRGIKLIDERHSGSEPRFFWVGRDSSGRVLTTRFTQRGAKIRIIGCGHWRKFARHYYEAENPTEDES